MFTFGIIVAAFVAIGVGVGVSEHMAQESRADASAAAEDARVASIAAQAQAIKDSAIAKAKARLVDEDQNIIGLRDPRLVVSTVSAWLSWLGDAFTVTKFDTTTYPDRALLTLTNDEGKPIQCAGISIQGKCVIQHDEGFLWQYKDYADIETNGENALEVSNRFIIDTDQIESIGDHLTKELAPHSMYQLQISGCHFEYEIGDVWHLALSYTINGMPSECELIDTDVEVTSVSFSRSVGGIGETVLEVRVPSGAWSKTTSRRARLISAGLPQWLNNRGNQLLVASSTYTGQADYYCDGTDDNVEIQAAIDAGAETVLLTHGTYSISEGILMQDGVNLYGSGTKTILMPSDNSVSAIIYFGSTVYASINDILIDGNGSSIVYDTNVVVIDGSDSGKANNITVKNFILHSTASGRWLYLFRNISALNCTCSNNEISTTSSESRMYAFYSCSGVSLCSVSGNISTGNNVRINAFSSCDVLSLCLASSNSTDGSYSNINAFISCSNISSCSVLTNSTSGNISDINCFTQCSQISSCSASGNTSTGSSANIYGNRLCSNGVSFLVNGNTTSGATSGIYSYFDCDRLVSCSTSGNVSSLYNEYGFYGCNSVQQCKSSGDSNPYTTSYADSGTANACADTAAGGYNS